MTLKVRSIPSINYLLLAIFTTIASFLLLVDIIMQISALLSLPLLDFLADFGCFLRCAQGLADCVIGEACLIPISIGSLVLFPRGSLLSYRV